MTHHIEKYPYTTITILWLCVYTCHLGVLYPNIMEARNFITAREMLTHGHWLLTTMDGFPRYEKPPLPTWLTAVSGNIFGIQQIWALRLPAALITLLLLYVTYGFGQKIISLQQVISTSVDNSTMSLQKRFALIVTLVLGTSFYIIFAGRTGTWDIYAHGFMLMGIFFLFLFFQNKTSGYANALIAGIFIGLSFMSKGPIAHYALLLPFIIAYGLTYKFKNFKSKWLPLILMLLVIALLSSWWAVYVYLMDTDAATRIAEKEPGRWIGYELKPFYYYWSFFTQSGIWTIPAFVGLLWPYLQSKVAHKHAYKFALLWTIFSVLLLSLIPTKKSRYLLPVLIPLALTTAFYLEYLFRSFKTMLNNWEKFPVYLNFGIIALIGLSFPLGCFLYFGENLEGYYVNFVALSVALFALGTIIVYNLYKRRFPQIFYASIAFIMAIVAIGFPISNALLGNPDYKSIASLAKNDKTLFALEGLTPELLWDYGKITKRITEEALINEPVEEEVLILTHFNEEKNRLDALEDQYFIEWIETFDINPTDNTARGYKNRLKADLYRLTKKLEICNTSPTEE